MIRAAVPGSARVSSCREFPRMPYAEAMQRYGSDKPDLRIPLELVDVDDLMKDVDFKVFSGPANDAEGRVAALRVPRRRRADPQADRRVHQVRRYLRRQGAGLHQGQRTAPRALEGLQSPIVKFLDEHRRDAGHHAAGGRRRRRYRLLRCRQDAASSTRQWARCVSGWVRTWTCYTRAWAPLWVVDFPMFEDDDDGQPDRACTIRSRRRRAARKSWQDRPGQRAVPGLRHGAQRHRARRRLDPYSRSRHAADGIRRPGHRRGRGPRRSSASCSMRCKFGARRTAAWPSVWTAW